MGNFQTKISIHNCDGWKGQYERIVRWNKRLESYNRAITNIKQLHDFLDILYATYQNIFHLKDWLYKDKIVTRKELNDFINQNTEIGLCRDIANGTKHFTLDDNFSVCNNFIIMSMWDPSNNDKYWRDRKIRIMSRAGLFDPFGLAKKCLFLWTEILSKKNLLVISNEEEILEKIDAVYYVSNIQTIYGEKLRRKKTAANKRFGGSRGTDNATSASPTI